MGGKPIEGSKPAKMQRAVLALFVFAIASVYGYASGYSSGSAAASSYASSTTPTASASAASTTGTKYTQTVTFDLDASTYTAGSDIMAVYNAGYGMSLGVYSKSGVPYSGCLVTSKVVTRRASTNIEFTTVVPKGSSYETTATSNIKKLTKDTLKSSIVAANTALGKSVAAPKVTTMGVYTITSGSSVTIGGGSFPGWAIAVIIISVFVVCCCPLIIFCACFGGIAFALHAVVANPQEPAKCK